MGIKKNTTTDYNIYQTYDLFLEGFWDCWDVLPCDSMIDDIIEDVDIAEDYWGVWSERDEEFEREE